MTSLVTREQVEDTARLCGVKDPRRIAQLMRVVDLYAIALARKMSNTEEDLPEPDPEPKVNARYMYKCRGCGERYSLDFFPEAKRRDPALAMDCLACGGGERPKLYTCTGRCGKAKPLDEFPERKRNDPKLRTPCEYCDRRRITVQDAGHVVKR